MLRLIEKCYSSDKVLKWYSSKALPEQKCPHPCGHVFIGHFHYGVQDRVFEEYDLVTFLRNPVERAISQLYFYRRSYLNREDPAAKRHQDWFRENDTPFEFINRSKNWLLDNAMVRMISGVRHDVPFGELNDSHLEVAMDNLSKFSYVGFQESFGIDIKNLAKLYGWRKVALPANIRRENQYIGSSQRRGLIQYNRLDLALYQYAIAVRADRLRELGLPNRWRSREAWWLRALAGPMANLRDIRYKIRAFREKGS